MKAFCNFFLCLAAGLGISSGIFTEVPEAISFNFKGETFTFTQRMYPDISRLGVKGIGELNLEKFDTASNVFYAKEHYVEIIRQDHKIQPHKGLALGFNFNPEQDSLPFVAEKAVMQFRDFIWGGIQFSKKDTVNFTGVVNEFSQDFILTVTSFEHDTIEAEFKGVLLNGAGEMTALEEGVLRIGLLRRE